MDPLVLDGVPEMWRGAFATGIYAGLRKGEILALKRSDVDLDNRLLYVRRSNGADITKGGHEDGIPIAESSCRTSAMLSRHPRPIGSSRNLTGPVTRRTPTSSRSSAPPCGELTS